MTQGDETSEQTRGREALTEIMSGGILNDLAIIDLLVRNKVVTPEQVLHQLERMQTPPTADAAPSPGLATLGILGEAVRRHYNLKSGPRQ